MILSGLPKLNFVSDDSVKDKIVSRQKVELKFSCDAKKHDPGLTKLSGESSEGVKDDVNYVDENTVEGTGGVENLVNCDKKTKSPQEKEKEKGEYVFNDVNCTI